MENTLNTMVSFSFGIIILSGAMNGSCQSKWFDKWQKNLIDIMLQVSLHFLNNNVCISNKDGMNNLATE